MIEHVVENGLCTQCGTCVGVCPTRALVVPDDPRMNQYPRLVEELCTWCDLCVETCSGVSYDFGKTESRIAEEGRADPNLGRVIGSYVGYAVDVETRRRAASGGLATALLVHALRAGLIDGAVVAEAGENGISPRVFVARTEEEIRRAAGSKYVPVAGGTSLLDVIRVAGRYAIVGLPCHIHGIRKVAERLERKVGARVVYTLSVFCSHTKDAGYVRALLHETGVASEDVRSLRFRGNGWPGEFAVETRSGEERIVPYGGEFTQALWKSYAFGPRRCFTCPDVVGETADVSLGDAWLRQYTSTDRAGTSVAVSHTRAGEDLLRSAMRAGALALEPIEPELVVESQKKILYFKKVRIKARRRILAWFGVPLPHHAEGIAVREEQPTAFDYVHSFGTLAIAAATTSPRLGPFFEKAPWHWALRARDVVFFLLGKEVRRKIE